MQNVEYFEIRNPTSVLGFSYSLDDDFKQRARLLSDTGGGIRIVKVTETEVHL